MNKTFNDPSTKYSDQGTPIAQAKSVADSIASVEQAVTGLGTGVATLTEEVDSLGQAISILPVPETTDVGKVVTATDRGTYGLADVDALPAISAGDAGKVLTVNAGETGAEWAAGGGVTIREVEATISVTDLKIQSLCNGNSSYEWISSNKDKAADEYAILGKTEPAYWEIASSADSSKKVTLIAIPGFGTSYNTAKYTFTLTLFRVTDPIPEFTYTGPSKSKTSKVLLIKGVQSGS